MLKNTVSHNTGGIHVTDGVPAGSIGASAFGYTSLSGPSHGNLISGNEVIDNVWDCGISLPSHNSFAVNAAPGIPGTVADGSPGTPNPALGGVYDNTITGNVIVGTGTASPGAGVLVFSAASAGASPVGGTVIKDNRIADDTYGIFLANALGSVISGNRYSAVHVAVEGS